MANETKKSTHTPQNLLIVDETKSDTEDGMLLNLMLDGNPKDIQSALFHIMTGAGPLYLKNLREANDKKVAAGIAIDNSYRELLSGQGHTGTSIVSGREYLFG